jgi:hypothetical protein
MLAGAASATCVIADANAATYPELSGGPVVAANVGGLPGYRMAVLAAPLGGHAVVALELERVRGSAVQTAIYRFSLPKHALRIGRGLVSATLDTGSGLGRFGRIRMTFSCRRRAARSTRTGCVGSPHARSGTLTGVLDVHTGVGRIRARSLPAKLVTKKMPLPSSGSGASLGAGQPTSAPNCRQYPHAAVLAVIPTSGKVPRDFALVTFLVARTAAGPAELVLVLARQRPPATETVTLEAGVPRSSLTLSGTRSARFGASGTPFLRGRLSFSGAAPLPGCTHRGAIGTATGSLRARTPFGTVPILTAHTPGAVVIAPAPGSNTLDAERARIAGSRTCERPVRAGRV